MFYYMNNIKTSNMASRKRCHVRKANVSSTDDAASVFTVSVLIPDAGQKTVLLINHEERGWWLPNKTVTDGEDAKTVAEKCANSVSYKSNSVTDSVNDRSFDRERRIDSMDRGYHSTP